MFIVKLYYNSACRLRLADFLQIDPISISSFVIRPLFEIFKTHTKRAVGSLAIIFN